PFELCVVARPPRLRAFSKSTTRRPARARYVAAVSPASPPPMTATSVIELDRSFLVTGCICSLLLPAPRVSRSKGYRGFLLTPMRQKKTHHGDTETRRKQFSNAKDYPPKLHPE